MTDIRDNRYFNLFNRQVENQYVVANTSYSERIAKLSALQRAIAFTYRDKIREALHADLKRPIVESDIVAIYLVIKEIKHAKANLHQWMKRKRVQSQFTLFGSKS